MLTHEEIEAKKEELTNNSTGKTETQLKIESVKVDKKYCTYCGEELPMNASFCKRCGKSVEIIKVKNINNTRKCPYCFREVARVKQEGLFIELLTVDKLLEYEEPAGQGKIF